jgi:hypothetical protein
MKWSSRAFGKRQPSVSAFVASLGVLPIFLLSSALPLAAQVTVDTRTGDITNGESVTATVDRRYQQIEPTRVDLLKAALDAKTRLELISLLQSEQGFAMRPIPRGHKGLTLEANGPVSPSGEGWLSMVTAEGVSAKPGDRLVISDVKIEGDKIVFLLNGGPDRKHRFLSHVQLGTGTRMSPVVQDNNNEPTGARLTLVFKGRVPELTGQQVKALLAPLISFDLKTPIQAFTDTLPPKLKEAILDHHVLVGMSTEMVLFARGQPVRKVREMDGQMPFEEWIYGQPPQEVEFVRINGNRVIRVELAQVGQPPRIFEKDEVEGLMRPDGSPVFKQAPSTRTVAEGDVEHNPDTQAPAAPPSLRTPGEALPQDSNKDRVGPMRPVHFPTPKPAESQPTEPQTTPQPGQPASQPAQVPQPTTVDSKIPVPASEPH